MSTKIAGTWSKICTPPIPSIEKTYRAGAAAGSRRRDDA